MVNQARSALAAADMAFDRTISGETRQLNRSPRRVTFPVMSTVQEIETALRRLTPAEMRAVRDWLDDVIDHELEFTPEFAAKIARSEREMNEGAKPRSLISR